MAGPFVRVKDLQFPREDRLPDGDRWKPFIKNDGPVDFELRWSAVQITGSVVDPAVDVDQYTSQILLKGRIPDQDDMLNFGIIPLAIKAGEVGEIVLSGETFARLIGPTGEEFCTVEQNKQTLMAGSGGTKILFDPGPDNPAADPEGERIALVSLSGGGGSSGSTAIFSIDEIIEDIDGFAAAQCTVLYRPCGVATLPGEEYGKITVLDTLGCFFDEPQEDLVDRKGHAGYFESQDSGYSQCRWMVLGLCCPPGV